MVATNEQSAKRTRMHRGTEYQISAAHPLCDALPWMTDDELQAMANTIRSPGRQRLPIMTLPDGRIVDGRHRELACRIAGVEPWYHVVRPTESEMPGMIEELNLHRRHLTTEERREWVRRLRGQGHSTRVIADRVGISAATVRRDIQTKSTATFDAVDLPERVTGRDGRSRPATRPAPAAAQTTSATQPRATTDAVKDGRGRVVPAALVPLFAAGSEYVRRMRDLLAEAEAISTAAAGEPWGAAVGGIMQAIEIDASNIREAARSSVPYAVCPHVGDDGWHAISRTCRACQGRGWGTRGNWSQWPNDVKALADQWAGKGAMPEADAA